ncbi:hypothetical protein M3765_23670 [Streptomyces thermoviolaceus]|uniref:SCO2583 family membrane protein n=1 Tax=Streptomyces thermoviolaceus TaxID=1952 RepID=UPI0020405E7C|nr:hypothetical protein [Streptomyces thermoviolaceus]MCM3266948.1 hypothetical protein [Streptomyces thermoviolaceus]
MGGPGEPPEGTPEGPSGAEDEYRSIVFDESFVRAAPLQEYSARERITDHTPAVRRRPGVRHALPRQALLFVLLVVLAFVTAVYMGVRGPNPAPQAQRPAVPPRTTVVPLAPQGTVPGADDPARLYAHSPAKGYLAGAEGIALPTRRDAAHFSDGQVLTALSYVREYLVASSLDPEVLTAGRYDGVRSLLDKDQRGQFDESVAHPAADGRHALTGWLVHFAPDRARLADPQVRTKGTLQVREADPAVLEVTADVTFVYAVKPAASSGTAQASLFTVRREMQFRLDRDDLRAHQVQLVLSDVRAGPLSCAEDSAARFGPVLAGRTAEGDGPSGTDPYARDGAMPLCGSLSPAAEPQV